MMIWYLLGNYASYTSVLNLLLTETGVRGNDLSITASSLIVELFPSLSAIVDLVSIVFK